MKRLVFILFALFVAACADKGGGGANTVAVTPTDMRCINGSAVCNTAAYGNYSGWTTYSYPYGSTQYNYSTYFNQNGFCGCPMGYSPAYNGSMGLGCIDSRYVPGNSIYMVFSGGFTGWGGGGSVNNQPQVSNIPNSGNQGICNRNLTQSCLLDQANSCSTGATCRQVISGSNLGVCANPNQVLNNNYPYGNNNPYGYGYGYGYYY